MKEFRIKYLILGWIQILLLIAMICLISWLCPYLDELIGKSNGRNLALGFLSYLLYMGQLGAIIYSFYLAFTNPTE